MQGSRYRVSVPGFKFRVPGSFCTMLHASYNLYPVPSTIKIGTSNIFLSNSIMVNSDSVVDWLLQGDPAVRWQVHADLLDSDEEMIRKERKKVTTEGWGAKLLERQDEEGTWARALYSPKWTSTTYTLLLLRRLGLDPNNRKAQKGSKILLEKGFSEDYGINYWSKYTNKSETCVTGMTLSILVYFNIKDKRLTEIAEHLLHVQMDDGGWNCRRPYGATHSSFHTTLIVLEAFHEYLQKFDEHRNEVLQGRDRAIEFLLQHRLYKSHRTGRIVKPQITQFCFPPRWYYDVMTALDYLRSENIPKEERMQDGIDLVLSKRKKNGTWLLPSPHPGKTFFTLESSGKPSRMNTLRGMRILRWWET